MDRRRQRLPRLHRQVQTVVPDNQRRSRQRLPPLRDTRPTRHRHRRSRRNDADPPRRSRRHHTRLDPERRNQRLAATHDRPARQLRTQLSTRRVPCGESMRVRAPAVVPDVFPQHRCAGPAGANGPVSSAPSSSVPPLDAPKLLRPIINAAARRIANRVITTYRKVGPHPLDTESTLDFR